MVECILPEASWDLDVTDEKILLGCTRLRPRTLLAVDVAADLRNPGAIREQGKDEKTVQL